MTPENIWGIQQLNPCQKHYEPADDDITTVVHIYKPSPLATFYQLLLYFKIDLFWDHKGQMSELFACRINKKELSTEWLEKMTITVWCPSGHFSVRLSIDQSEQEERCHCFGEGRAHPFCRERKLGQRQDAYTSNDLIVLGCLRLPATTGFP